MSKYDIIQVVEKFNPNHDAQGRFASASGGGGAAAFTPMNNKEAREYLGGLKNDAVLAITTEKNGTTLYRKDYDGEAKGGKWSAWTDGEWRPGIGSVEGAKSTFKYNVTQGALERTLCSSGTTSVVERKYRKTGELVKSADIDEIEVVEKFNPFHDAAGKFSSSNGFKTYSANPNTRAGAMAIARSAAAGHGNTANVHSQSYGENITQNAQWIGRGAKTPLGGTIVNGAAHLRGKERRGLAAASATGADWQAQNTARGRTTGPGKQPAQQQPQKPAPTKQTQTQQNQQKPTQQQQQAQQQQNTGDPNQTLKNQVQDVYLSSGDKLANQPRDWNGQPTTTNSVAKAHYQDRVDGKDISATVDVSKVRGSKDPIDKMAELQGWNKQPTVTDDLETFQKAAKQSGCVMIRSVTSNSSANLSADEVCKKTMTDGNSPLGGNGMKAYGSGMYMVKTDFGNNTGRNLAKRIAAGQDESYGYGGKQMMATLHPNAKVATPTQASRMKSDFLNMSPSQRRKYGDWGAYIASKGYDAAQWHDSSDPGAYATVYNKTALIFYNGVATR